MVGLLDEQQAKETVRGYLDSREWWFFMDPEHQGWIMEVEETFYSGSANDDFVAMLIPAIVPEAPVLGLYFGRKTRVTKGKLEAWLREKHGAPAEWRIGDEQDCLIFAKEAYWSVLPAIIGGWAGIK